MTTLVADVEADGLLPDLTRLWCLCIGDPKTGDIDCYADQPGYRPIEDGLARLREADRVVFHNGLGYDLFAIEKVYPGTLRFEQIWDTLVVGRLLDPEEKFQNLKDIGARLGYAKVENEEWDKFTPTIVERCMVDVEITIKHFRKLWKRAKGWEEAVALEHKVALVLSLQEQNGYPINLEAALELSADLRQEQTDIERELQELFPPIWVPEMKNGKPKVVTPKKTIRYRDPLRPDLTEGAPYTEIKYQPFNPGSRKQIEYRLRKTYRWKPTKFTNTGAAQLDDEVLQDLAVQIPELKPLARYFRVQKQLGQIADGDNAWLKLYVDHGNGDYRVHGRVNPNGTATGRMSHFAPNLAQVDKKDLRMREVWIPSKGKKQVGVDAESLELRMLGHYLAKWDGGTYSRAVVSGNKEDGTDPHTLVQKLAGLHKRDNAKTLTYAYVYGAGDKKLGLIIIQDYDEAGVPRPKKSPSALGKEARAKLEKGLKGLDRLIRAVRKRHRERGYLIGLDGRKIYTRSDHSALNYLLQGAGAVVMKKALAIFHFEEAVRLGWVSSNFLSTSGFAYLANVHDEVQIEADPEIAEEIGKTLAHCITLAGERLGMRCPLSGAYDIGNNWKETH